MPLSVGQSRVDATTGMCERLFTGLSLRLGWAGMNDTVLTPGSGARDAISAILDGIADGLYNILITDARVNITIPQDALGPGIPAAPVDITGGRIV